MAVIENSTWKIEVGVKPDPSHYNGFTRTESFRLFANTHNKAVEILKGAGLRQSHHRRS